MNDEAFIMACPVCRDNCNCTSCLSLEMPLQVSFFSTLTFAINYIYVYETCDVYTTITLIFGCLVLGHYTS